MPHKGGLLPEPTLEADELEGEVEGVSESEDLLGSRETMDAPFSFNNTLRSYADQVFRSKPRKAAPAGLDDEELQSSGPSGLSNVSMVTSVWDTPGPRQGLGPLSPTVAADGNASGTAAVASVSGSMADAGWVGVVGRAVKVESKPTPSRSCITAVSGAIIRPDHLIGTGGTTAVLRLPANPTLCQRPCPAT